MTIHQDARVYAGLVRRRARTRSYALPQGRAGYVHVARGALTVNGQKLEAGDALKTDAAQIEHRGRRERRGAAVRPIGPIRRIQWTGGTPVLA